MNRESQFTKAQAIALHESGWWKQKTPEEVALFQLNEPCLCMPFDEFQMAVEKLLGRGVWTHEFADPASLIAEHKGERKAPTMQEILELIPAEKRIVMVTP